MATSRSSTRTRKPTSKAVALAEEKKSRSNNRESDEENVDDKENEKSPSKPTRFPYEDDVFSSDNDGMLSEPEVAESKASSKKVVSKEQKRRRPRDSSSGDSVVIVEDVSPKKKKRNIEPAPRTPSPPVLLSDDDNPFDERSHKPLTPSLTKKLKSVTLDLKTPKDTKQKEEVRSKKNKKTNESDDSGSDDVRDRLDDNEQDVESMDGKESEIKCAITDENATIDPLLAQSCKNLPPLEEIRCTMDEVATYYLSEALEVRNFDSQYHKHIVKLFSLKEEGDWLINPSRYDPRQLTSQSTTGTSKNTKDLVKITGNGSRRVACLSFGIVKSCNLFEAAEMSGSGSGKIVKSINLGLFTHEQERLLSCIDMAYKPLCAKVNTYAEGIVFATIPKQIASIRPASQGKEAANRTARDRIMMSPARTRIGPVALGPNAPTLDRFLTPILQKRSALFADEKVPLYDATGFFNPARARKDTTISKILESSPCIQEEFQEGDLVGVIYTVSAQDAQGSFVSTYRYNILTAFKLAG